MSSMSAVRVNRKAAERVLNGHLWIFTSDLIDRGGAEPGAFVKVIDPKGRALGTAHFSSTSQITLRLLSRHVEPVDEEFFSKRMEAALAYRKLVVENSDSYRLIHAEGDLLPGLIVDKYGDYLAVQFLDQGMDRQTAQVVGALTKLLAPKGIVARNDVPVRSKEGLPLETKVLAGHAPPAIDILLNGLHFAVDLTGGQKTGIFLDQRENYTAVANYARGGRALDCFSGSGGFALHLARRCESVEAVDSSAAAVAAGRANATANHIGNIEFHEANALQYLPGLVSARRAFDLVVVDPPAFTRTRESVEDAARGYKEINLRALRLLKPGGILVSCSCSHHMNEARLFEVVAQAALDCGRRLRVMERRTQARDHPILLTVPETHYLKCLVFLDVQ